ncbi:hypothetical protein [Mesorhizobium sp. B1-1-4]|uniref:hypothetical protein n=1 Tax=Mesorhizobium sp. B1-1-4 TaxID=2589980 RepID=UPI001FEFFF21|nr:hypothetical protein [Mesorhizobium sp. B1-1-4]
MADDGHPGLFLAFDQLAVKEVDKGIAFAGFQRVLPQFDDRGGERCCLRCGTQGQAHKLVSENRVIILFYKTDRLSCFVNLLASFSSLLEGHGGDSR